MIRPMTPEDIPVVVKQEEMVFGNSLGEKLLHYELLENQFAEYYVLDVDGVIGYIGLWCIFENGQITNFYINPENQGKGYGKELLEYAIKIFKEKVSIVTLEVRKSNERAKTLYEKYGFYVGGIRKNYYKNGEDALLMVFEIEGDYNDNSSN